MARILEHKLSFRNYIQQADPYANPYQVRDKKGEELVREQACYGLNAAGNALESASTHPNLRTQRSKSLVRIFNAKGWLFDEGVASASLTPAQYLYLQRLGLTRRVDDALTAKVIGTLGQYRFALLKAEKQWGIKSGLVLAKRQILDNTFKRLEFLKTVERAHGQSKADLQQAYREYQELIRNEIAELSDIRHASETVYRALNTNPLIYNNYDVMKNEINSFINTKIGNLNSTKTDEQLREFQLRRIQLLGLAKDYFEARKLEDKINDIDGEALANTRNGETHGYDQTRNLVANFVKDRMSHIIRKARYANESITIAGGTQAFFRGYLNRVLSEAELLKSNYIFDQNQAIQPEHQGNYTSDLVTVLSTDLVGSGKQAIRNFLFGVNYAIIGDNRPEISGNSIFNRNHFLWLRKLFRANRNEASIKSYYEMRQFSKEANLHWAVIVWEDVIQIPSTLGKWIKLSGKSIAKSTKGLAFQLRDDFRWQEKAPLLQGSSELQAAPNDPIAADLIADASDLPELKAGEKDKFLKMLRDLRRGPDLKAPLALPFYRLRPFQPNDPFSKLMGGAESFCDFVAQYYEINPQIATFSSFIYLLSAAAIISPELMSKLPASFKFISTWSTDTATAISKSELSRVVSAAFSNYEEVLFALDLLTDGNNSTLASAATYFKNHPVEITAGAALLLGAGYASIYTPGIAETLREDAGNLVVLEPTMLVAKGGVIVYESLHGEEHESSVFAKLVHIILQVPIWLLRFFVLMPINIISKLSYDAFFTQDEAYKINSTWNYVLTPLFDLRVFIKLSFLSLIDAALRLFNLLGRVIKLTIKAPFEALMNAMATLLSRPLSILLSVVAGLCCFFLFPAGGPFLIIAAVFTASLLGALLTQGIYSQFKIDYSVGRAAKAVLYFKHRVFGVFNQLSSGVKKIYQAARNKIARSITRDKHLTGHDIIASYGSSIDTSYATSFKDSTPASQLNSTDSSVSIEGLHDAEPRRTLVIHGTSIAGLQVVSNLLSANDDIIGPSEAARRANLAAARMAAAPATSTNLQAPARAQAAAPSLEAIMEASLFPPVSTRRRSAPAESQASHAVDQSVDSLDLSEDDAASFVSAASPISEADGVDGEAFSYSETADEIFPGQWLPLSR